LVDQLVGLDSFLYANTPQVVERIESGELAEVGSGSTINVERVLEIEPDIVMSYGSGFPEYDAHPVLLDAGIFVAMNSDYVEEAPLGRAEWIKFTAMFYNLEAVAERIFDEKVTAYNELLALTADIPQAERPEVLWNSFSSFTEAWSIPGAETYAGTLLHDAGAQIALGELALEESANIDFEIVYDEGLDADYWFPGLFGIGTLDDVLVQDERYADFAAVQNGTVYNSDARVNANGGNDVYETGVVNPHLVLADLIAILHPDLLPDHEILFFRALP